MNGRSARGGRRIAREDQEIDGGARDEQEACRAGRDVVMAQSGQPDAASDRGARTRRTDEKRATAFAASSSQPTTHRAQ